LPSSRQQIIVLAMAAPDLKVNLDGPTSVDTLRDLFNTFVAGFQLSRDVDGSGEPFSACWKTPSNRLPEGSGGARGSPYWPRGT